MTGALRPGQKRALSVVLKDLAMGDYGLSNKRESLTLVCVQV